MTGKEIKQLLEAKKYHDVRVVYLHDQNVRTAYFRAKSVEEAVRSFGRVSCDPILQVVMFDE